MRLGEIWRRLAFLLRREDHFNEIEEEMRLHSDLRARALRKSGLPPNAAAAAAQRRFGNRTVLKEAAWDVWMLGPLENAWRDLKFALRVLRASPGFTLIAILTLALGIGATTAMFSIIDNVLLEPFPYAHQQRLMSIVIRDLSSHGAERTVLPATELLDYKEQSRIFEDVMGVAINRALWTKGGAPESVNAPLVTRNAFQFLGVAPLLGRFAVPSDVEPAAPPVCVMSYRFWQGRFGGDPNVIGRVMTLDGTPRTVIGVMPSRFVFWSADVWVPTALRRAHSGFPPPWFYLLGRLKPGLTLKAADHELQRLAERLAHVYRPNLYPYRFDARLETFIDASIGKFQRTLFTLLAAVGLLLLIACANVASLLLARVTSRKREFAIRSSLGAGWWRVLRQLFVESGVLAFTSAAAGCGFAWAGLKVLVAALPQDTFPDEAVIALNWRVLGATIAVAAATALFFGLVPLVGGLRQDVSDALKSGGREHSGFRHGQIRSVLIVCEVAISLLLLTGAGITLRSFLGERAVQPGFNARQLLTAQIFLNKQHRTIKQQAGFRRELSGALRQAPGVIDVATTSDYPPFGGAPTEFAAPGKQHSEQYDGQFALIDPNLFRTLDVPLVRGRNFTIDDVHGKHMVTLVNRAFVEKFFPHEDPIGKRVQITTLAYLPNAVPNPWFQIIGVVRDLKNRGLRQPVIPEAFVPYSVGGLSHFMLIARTAGDPKAISKMVESAALTLDGSAAVRQVRTMQQALEAEEYAKPRFGLEIFGVFAILGLLLVSAGLYSIMSYTVSQRKREMGIRLALGAKPADVQRFVIGAGMRFVALGIATGLLASFVLLRLIQDQLWGVGTYDPLTLAAVVALLLVVGIAACYVPSRGATRIDPASTLRSD